MPAVSPEYYSSSTCKVLGKSGEAPNPASGLQDLSGQLHYTGLYSTSLQPTAFCSGFSSLFYFPLGDFPNFLVSAGMHENIVLQ